MVVEHINLIGQAIINSKNYDKADANGHTIDREFVVDLVSMAMDATALYLNPDESGVRQKVSLDLLKDNPGLVERAAVTGSLHNLLSYPWVKERVDAGKLALHGWWFDIETGDLWKSDQSDLHLMPVV